MFFCLAGVMVTVGDMSCFVFRRCHGDSGRYVMFCA